MNSVPLAQNRPFLGSVKLSVPYHLIISQPAGNNPSNFASCPLPDGVSGCIKVGLYHTFTRIIRIDAKVYPDVLLHCQLKWDSRDRNSTSMSSSGGAWSTNCLWLEGSGRIAELLYASTAAIECSVTVYGRPKTTPVVYGAMRSLTALSDVVLRAAGAEFPAHRLVLAARSPVLLAMFTGDYKETKDRAVDITVDCSAELFGLFVDFLYEGELGDLGYGELIPLLELSERYMVAELKEECVRQLLAVDVGDALAVFQAALDLPFVPEEVGRKAGELIKKNWLTVRESDAWSEFRKTRSEAARALQLVIAQTK